MINFAEYDDEKLLLFIELWESCPTTHLLNNKEVYFKAIEEAQKRGF